MRDSKMTTKKVITNVNEYKSDLNEMKKGKRKSVSQKVHCTILKRFKKHKTVSLNYLMIILELYLRLNINHSMEKEKILTPKQMAHRLPITLAKVKAANSSENLLHEIRKIIYSFIEKKK